MSGIAVYAAVNAVSLALSRDGIDKSRQASGFASYKFRGIDEVMNALSPLLVAHKLIIVPRILERECVERHSNKGNILFSVTVAAEFDFISAEDGSKFSARTYGEAMDSGDKATNKAMAIAYKYAAFQTFCIPTEGSGDTDADATVHEPIKPREPAPQASKPAEQSSTAENAPSKAAASVSAASPRKTAADVPTVAPGGNRTADWKAAEREKLAKREALEKRGEDIKNNSSAEVRGNLKFHLDAIKPEHPEARKKLGEWLNLAKCAKVNMTQGDQLGITGEYNLKLGNVGAAERRRLEQAPPKSTEADFDDETGELREAAE